MDFDLEILMRLGLAILWGGLVGAEREYRGKSAGFRTTILISFGACFFTLMSELIGSPGNPDRIASNIVTGIGFLGAGVIFRGDNRVNGITTAASIWAVAAVGMGIGGGYYFPAGCASLMILFVLVVLSFLERRIDLFHQTRTFIAKGTMSDNMLKKCEVLMKEHHLKIRLVKQIRDGNHVFATWQIQGRSENLEAFIDVAMIAPFIQRAEY
ncbi:MgtC/SapB family protein [Flavobacterium sp. LS1R49]|uniref:MgtC/SapB family protein n=1 Tax=Flavobacterium shii TaxID=2987687 RepID=A0A9X2YVF8_9FLAO|nr:MgtC/SapB family protein [Flavobacterium shii]MCV9928234.1 MgtC/SapB family protein [Flavobacterium shii]